MEVKATVQLSAKEMFGFLMHHIYSTVSGKIGVLISIGGMIGFIYMLGQPNVEPVYLGALFMTAIMFTVVQPAMTYSKAKKQVKKNEAVNAELQYVINNSGISVAQGEISAFSTWDEIVRIESTKALILLYTSKVHAYVIPKKDIGEQMDDFKTLVRENSQAGVIKL